MLFAQIIVPMPQAPTYTYAVPDELCATIRVGMRAIVPVGSRHFYTGIVESLSDQTTYAQVKSLVALLDDAPIVLDSQLHFWKWIAQYYRSSLGDVYKIATPSAFRLESETIVEFTGLVDSELTPKEQQLCDLLTDQHTHTIESLNKEMEQKNVFPLVKKLLQRGVVSIDQEIKEQFHERTESFVRLAPDYANQPIEETLTLLKRAKVQQQLVATLRHLSPKNEWVKKSELLKAADCNTAICSALIERGIVEQQEQVQSRLESFEQTQSLATLTPEQTSAYEQIKTHFATKNTVLLHGITSSGKTEIYTKLIADTLAQGKQVLYLVPEIALTTQLIARLRGIFGDKMTYFHSRMNNAERIEVWNNLLSDAPKQLIIGARTALFLPFQKLGLIIVDEEHDASYKQNDVAPHLQTRNCALVLAAQMGVKTLLGSATPSLESYTNALSGKYGLVELKTRYGNVEPPEILVADLTEAYRRKQMTGHLTDFLTEKIYATLAAHKQVILFQNRRGYAPYVECSNCGWTPRCPNCDVSLTYHQRFNKLNCHYCGHTQPLPNVCPTCHQQTLQTHGFGTEQVEIEIQQLFPKARVARMDLDSTRNKNAFATLISQFENHEIDILIGTQMLAKGLDFSNVELVGILNADNLLNYPDFRAHERAFQTLTQISGRAGRAERGLVVLQTSQIEHPIIQLVERGNYRAFFAQEMNERKLFNYPPYCRLMQITLKHRDPETLKYAANKLAYELRKSFADNVLGPDNPAVGRIKNQFIKHILIKTSLQSSATTERQQVDNCIQQLMSNASFKGLQLSFDVDVE